MLMAIEGIDGAGKGTLTANLARLAAAAGVTTATLSFPRYQQTKFAALIGQYLNGRFGALERALGVQDRPDRLTGDDPPRGEAPPVADAVDLVAHGLGVIAPANEVRPDGVGFELVVDRKSRGPKGLGDDLAAGISISSKPPVMKITLHRLSW